MSLHRTDIARAATAMALAAAQPLSTRAARWSGRGTPEVDAATATEGPVTPAGGAFVIWAPLFVGSLLHAASEAQRSRQGRSGDGTAAWWANAAMAGNVAWSLNSQFRRLDEASVGLIVGSAAAATTATALAERRPDTTSTTTLRRSFGALAGWLSVAAFANLEATLNLRRGHPDPGRAQRRAAVLLGVASTAASGVAVVLRGNPYYAAAAGWGLGGVAVKALRHEQPLVAAVAGAGLLSLAAGRRVGRP